MKYKNIEEAINDLTKTQKVSLWGDEIEFTPVVATEKVGNGKQLLQIWTIDQRPQYWYIRIDSETDVSECDFDIEEYLEILEEEFGKLDDEDIALDKFDMEYYYPQLIWQGGLWETVFNDR